MSANSDAVITDAVITETVVIESVITDTVITDTVITDTVITDTVITDTVITDSAFASPRHQRQSPIFDHSELVKTGNWSNGAVVDRPLCNLRPRMVKPGTSAILDHSALVKTGMVNL